jgi:GNAT superfamily N-acetyltransferase
VNKSIIANRPSGTPGIEAFLKSSYPSLWLEDSKMHVYVRKGHHALEDNHIQRTFDIANITVFEGLRGQGVFSGWLEYVETVVRNAGYAYIYVENIMEDGLAGFLVRKGYEHRPGVDTCLYRKLVGDQNE